MVVMSWLWNVMTPEVSDAYMFMKTAMEAWDSSKANYSKVGDACPNLIVITMDVISVNVFDYRKDWHSEVNQRVGYPINLGIYLKEKSVEFSILVDRVVGGSAS